jgi:AraC family transcriptional regulator
MLFDTASAIITDAELVLPVATIRLVRCNDARPPDHVMNTASHVLDLCVTPRPLAMRGCYRAQWGQHRFERLGDIVFVPAGHALHLRGDDAGWQSSISCTLHGDEIESWLGTPIDWTDQRLHMGLDLASLTVRHLLRRLATEVHAPGLGSRLLCEFLAGQLIVELGRHYDAIGDLPVTGGLAAWRLRLIDDRLHDASDPPGLVELAELCRVSVRQLTRGFRTSRGCSIGDYMLHHRIETAKRLLDDDSLRPFSARPA